MNKGHQSRFYAVLDFANPTAQTVIEPPRTGSTADRELPGVLALVEQLQSVIEGGERTKITEIIGQLVTLRAPMREQWQQLAHIAAGYGELTLARKAMDLFVENWGGHAAQFQKAGFLAMMGAWREVDALLRKLPASVPDPGTNAYVRGITALNLGNSDEARHNLERAAQMLPQSGQAWFPLSMVTDFSQEPDLADGLIAAEPALKQADLVNRIPYYYALGKMYSDRGDYAQAFRAFAQGGRLTRSAIAYDRDADQAGAARAIEGYSAERIAAVAREQHEPTARTIFVTGLPRSGTTLVEQVLTNHSAVHDGGETGRLLLLEDDVGGSSYPALARYVEAHGVASAAHSWDHWLDELYSVPGRIIDKTVTTGRLLGLAAALLPEAPLIWMTRDPLDRAWSCFRTNFSGSAMSWTYDLEDIAFHFRLEDELLARWQEILGERLLVVPYESMVTDPQHWIRKILAHCGLPEEPQVFAPHENRRPVTTASMMQVRQPINREGIGVAEPYRHFLQPFTDAYYG